MKRILLIGLAAIFLTFSGSDPAQAKVMIIDGLYTIDVPSGWMVSEKNKILTLASSDRQAVFLITRGLSVRQHRAKIANEAAKYSNITKANPERQSTINRLQGLRVVVTILGDHPDRTAIYYSINELEREKEKWRAD